MESFAAILGTGPFRTPTILRTVARLARSSRSPALVLGVVLASGLSANAGTPPVRTPVPVTTIRVAAAEPAQLGATTQPGSNSGKSAEVQTLQQAYATLAVADHDYKGHRVKAMKRIAAASKILGAPLSGDGKDKEKQTLSDAQLNQVIGMLQQVRGTAASNNQHKVVEHLNEAIRHLKIALTIR